MKQCDDDVAELVDIGANLTHASFRGDLDEVLSAAEVARVKTIVATGVSAASSRRSFELAFDRRSSWPRLYSTAGIHPHHASTISAQAIEDLRDLLVQPQVVAVGECGLDYDRSYSPREAQIEAFEAQLVLARESRKPVFLHERAAFDDFAAIVERHRDGLVAAVVHCFTGTRRELDRYRELDLHIGLTGWLCDERRGTHLRSLVGLVPEGRLMIETDAPFIVPRGHSIKTRRNEPRFLLHIARTIAEVRGEGLVTLARHTTATATQFFSLPDRGSTSTDEARRLQNGFQRAGPGVIESG